MACYTQRCIQGRQPCPTPYACSGIKTTCGGETVDNGLPIQMYEGTLDEDIRRGNVIATCIWLLASAVLVGLAIAVYGIWLS